MKNENKNKKDNLLIKIVITLLTFLALIVIAIPFSKYFLIASHTHTAEVKIHTEMPKKIPTAQPIKAPSLQSAIAGAQNSKNSDGTMNQYAIGQVVIPKVSINQPIFVGLTDENMTYGVVSLFPNRAPDKSSLTLIGHHGGNWLQWGYWLLFGGIQQLNKGDSVYVRYMNDYYEYKVEKNTIIKATDTDLLANKGPNYIFLVTCNQSTETPYRVLVTAKKVKNVNTQKIKSSFENSTHELTQKNTKRYTTEFILPLIITLIIACAFLIFIWRL